jgi:hypothetical protein
VRLCGDPASEERLSAIRKLYEPYAHALSDYLGMPVPNWIAEPKTTDQWSTVAGLRSTGSGAGRVGLKPELILTGHGHESGTHLHDAE